VGNNLAKPSLASVSSLGKPPIARAVFDRLLNITVGHLSVTSYAQLRWPSLDVNEIHVPETDRPPREAPPDWWTPLLSSAGSGKVSNGAGSSSIYR
jgi:hypothetical protein